MSTSKSKWMAGILGVLLTMGCAAPMVYIPDDKPLQPGAPLETSFAMPENIAPRERAAMELTRRGRAHLRRKQSVEAVRVLEKAVNLYPTGGRIYYYLSEAWLMRGNFKKAGNFNRLAELYLGQDDQWQQRIARQRKRISAPGK